MSEINPIALRLINMYPAPTNSAANNNYSRNGDRVQTDNQMDSRIDHRFSDNNNFFLRYSYGRTYTDASTCLSGDGGRIQSARVAEQYLWIEHGGNRE